MIGLLSMLAAVLGAAFLGLKKAAWLSLGVVYIALGVLYLTNRAGVLMRSFGPGLTRLRSAMSVTAMRRRDCITYRTGYFAY